MNLETAKETNIDEKYEDCLPTMKILLVED